MSDLHPADTLTGRILDYIGMGFLLVPPDILVMEVVLASGPINWALVIASFLGCYVVGALLLAAGLNWPKIKPRLSTSRANSINAAIRNPILWFLAVALFAFGPPILVGVFSKPGTGRTPPAAFVNPLHEDAVKWRIAEGIRSATIGGALSEHCHATIVSLQDQYAQDYAADFRKILDVINWKYNERFATSPVDRGITVRGVAGEIQSMACAITLANQLRTYGHTRTGSSLGNVLRWISTSDVPDYLKDCPQGLCIEVDFGNDDDPASPQGGGE